MIKGNFTIWIDEEYTVRGIIRTRKKKVVVPNTFTFEGENAILQMAFQGVNTIVAQPGGNFYMGLCGANLNAQGQVDKTVTLASLAGEPVAGGYARQAFTRDNIGWPLLSQVNGIWKITSRLINFTAVGADIGIVARAFICSVNAGNAGKLFCLSGQFPANTTITNGQTFPVQYEAYLN